MKNYGKKIPGLVINGENADYGVVNERAVRATAGIMFIIGIATFFYISKTGSYTPLYFTVPAFWLDFLLKTFWGPQYSIFGYFGKLCVSNQKPEYVGAIQKRFAWGIGFFMASTMMIISLGMGIRGVLPFTICLTCLTFMWLESAFGICVGCKIYYFLLNKKIIAQPLQRPACPGGACSIKK